MLPEGVNERFWEGLEAASRCVLMLDYDGTLAPFQVDRDKAFPYPGVREILERILENTDTRLVVISGRWTRDLKRLLSIQPEPEMFGSHGIERLFPDGRYEVLDIGEKAVAGLVEIDAMAIQDGLEKLIERKPGCLALHWRNLELHAVERLRQTFQDKWQVIAEQNGLLVTEFDGGMEVRAQGRDKGDAVCTILDEESEGVMAAYLGDDRTDEDAFEAIKGRGVGILVAEKSRPSKATVRLKPPEGMLEFLKRWAALRRRYTGNRESGGR